MTDGVGATKTVFDPVRIGAVELANRVVMAPMTRNRANADGVLPDSAATYYAQRASAGLIVTEGTQPSAAAKGYPGTPGIHDDLQEPAWRKVADAVHAADGRIFCQLMHTGRIGHPSLIPDDARIVAPSAIPAQVEVARADGVMVPAVMPESLTAQGIAGVVRDFAEAAVRAVRAGLDGVELHAANGYLLHQFLSPGTNRRRDEYGGSAQGRARFVIEVAEAVAAEIGAGRMGIRISPGGQFNDMQDKGNEDTYLALADGLAALRPAYLHTLRRRSSPLHREIRDCWPTAYILNTGYLGASELADVSPLIASGAADLVSVGRLFISNPDLVRRWRHDVPRAQWDEDTFYSGGDRGYIDYPFACEGTGER
ncbi:alkene reductase [Nocardia carnea]|uniref:Alkene reductase n=1 Tax=Nocardia carnea TaxID=37328 RepID=A0ABW7TML1_9NOCA|nr:alkene reductase [Nocardia carnea]